MSFKRIIHDCLGRLKRELLIISSKLSQEQQWVFIVGCYNSGTTLVHNILKQHGSIASLPDEGQHYTDQLPKDYLVGYPRLWVLKEKDFRMGDEGCAKINALRLQKEWSIRMSRKAPIFLEKTIANSGRIRWFNANFPRAKFIVVIREPYAVCEGIVRKTMGGGIIRMSAAAKQWRRTYEIIKEDTEALKNVHWVKYEDFVDAPEKELKKLTDFLNIEEMQNNIFQKKINVFGINKGIYNHNLQSISKLSEDDKREIDNNLGDARKIFDYMIESD